MNTTDFFKNLDNQEVFRQFNEKLNALEPNAMGSFFYLIPILKDFTTAIQTPVAGMFDAKCGVSINQIGRNFISALLNVLSLYSTNPNHNPKEEFIRIMLMINQFCCEYELSCPYNETLQDNGIISSVKSSIANNLRNFDENTRLEITKTNYLLPIAIFKKLFSESDINEFKKCNENINKVTEISQEIDSKIETVKKLKEDLDEYKMAFNFVGLYKGFDSLANIKKKEAKDLLSNLKVMGLLVTAPLLIEITLLLSKMINDETLDPNHWMILPPIVSIELIFIYFFRIILLNHKSVKTQILQIELRMTLCQFIHDYAKQSKDLKDKNPNALEKFENLIFSGIISDSEALPSSFDGIEQIAKLVSSIRGGKDDKD